MIMSSRAYYGRYCMLDSSCKSWKCMKIGQCYQPSRNIGISMMDHLYGTRWNELPYSTAEVWPLEWKTKFWADNNKRMTHVEARWSNVFSVDLQILWKFCMTNWMKSRLPCYFVIVLIPFQSLTLFTRDSHQSPTVDEPVFKPDLPFAFLSSWNDDW